MAAAAATAGSIAVYVAALHLLYLVVISASLTGLCSSSSNLPPPAPATAAAATADAATAVNVTAVRQGLAAVCVVAVTRYILSAAATCFVSSWNVTAAGLYCYKTVLLQQQHTGYLCCWCLRWCCSCHRCFPSAAAC
jgi:hypothetical protein